jgi:NADPH:quinone reductase-like Zn-dependent oxidoreductase
LRLRNCAGHWNRWRCEQLEWAGAKFRSAHVIVVGSNGNKLKLVESLGVEAPITRSKVDDWPDPVYLTTGKSGVDVVIDNNGTTFNLSMRTLDNSKREASPEGGFIRASSSIK